MRVAPPPEETLGRTARDSRSASDAAGLGLHLPTRVAFYLVRFVYLYLALRRVYRQARALTLVKAFVLLACEVALFTLIVFGAAFAAIALT